MVDLLQLCHELCLRKIAAGIVCDDVTPLRLCMMSRQFIQNRSAESFLILRRDQCSHLTVDKLRQTTFIGADNRQSAGHRLQGDESERLPAGGHYKNIRRVVEPPQLVLLLVAKEEGVPQTELLVQL